MTLYKMTYLVSSAMRDDVSRRVCEGIFSHDTESVAGD
jgi:hypothetical protein